VFVIFVRNMDI